MCSRTELTVLDASTHSEMGTITLPGTAQSGVAVDTTSNIVYVPVAGCTNEPELVRTAATPAQAGKDKGESSQSTARPTASSVSITSTSEQSRLTRARASSTESPRM